MNRWLQRTLLLGLVISSVLPASAADSVAATPPMGWSSWDAWGSTINQSDFERTADYMHNHLQKYGWRYMDIDADWYAKYPEKPGIARKTQGFVISDHGLYLPAPNRYPAGFSGMAKYVHSLGLKFGVYIVHGIPREAVQKNLPVQDSSYTAAQAADTSDTCTWNSDNYGVKDNAAGQAYYDSMLKLYAHLGADLLKVDCISKPYHADEIAMIKRAIAKTGRPMVLSLSPGPTPLDRAKDVSTHSNMWRISDDMWDVWFKPASAPTAPQAVTRQFGLLAEWTPYRGSGHWPDADMLPIGFLGPHPGMGKPRASRLTPPEERTLVTLWSIARSPLIMGGNLLRMDPYTLSLMTNPEVIAVDQHSHGNHALVQNSHGSVWMAQGERGRYVAVFNLQDKMRTMDVSFHQLGFSGMHKVRDLWARNDLAKVSRIHVEVPAHGCRLLLVEDVPDETTK